MWSHARLVRLALVLSSALTLSGLHQQRTRLPVGWRVARLLPLTLLAANSAANLAYIAGADSAWQVLDGLSVGISVNFILLLLVYLHCRRRQLHELLGGIDRLEAATAAGRRPRDYRAVRTLVALAFTTSVSAMVLWIGAFGGADTNRPKLVVKVWMPETLRDPSFYWVVFATQIVCTIVITVTLAVFNVILYALMGAVELFQERLSRFCQENFCTTGQPNANTFSITNELDGTASSPSATRPSRHGVQKINVMPLSAESNADDVTDSLEAGSAEQPLPAPGPLCADTERCLRLLTEVFRSVRQLATEAAELCSVPIFWVHASYTGALLIGSYITIAHSLAAHSGREALGFASYTAVNMLQLLLVSWAGSRATERGWRLHRALAEARWPPALSPAARFCVQQLLEQTRRPATFDGCGVFIVQKANLLSLLGFVLTYFIIMLQMRVALG
ncbi:hypothetical protein FJT64_003819 [Amphibalanus amphitrite]|uniref:Odorant receptor n=1 Tax=Amphibalanus amphitrite TaxID=1232801 RepID=A0A6A4W0S8_AMPAM|nr:hypothetical protein FJT64_003819 [Amphibalanus amphitrite]